LNLEQFNSTDKELLFNELEKCCGSKQWVKRILAARPYSSVEILHQFSDKIWAKLSSTDYLEAFTHHPQIGDIDSLKKKFASTANWAGDEQQGTSDACDEILQRLKQGNQDYLNKFGFIFIVCATGKTAQEMLDLLNDRLPNDKAIELHNAAAEQNKITHLRLDKLLQS
jgi:2-oxo-4-hydroxy-4-carboxy-5-ureidoimidazoline decarboxylase